MDLLVYNRKAMNFKQMLAGFILLSVSVPTFAQTDSLLTGKGAEFFKSKCVSCHAFGKVLVGPDLKLAKAKPNSDLNLAFDRMQAMVGPISVDQRNELLALIHSENPDAILNPPVQEGQVEKLPGNPQTGESLYYGETALKNGGMSCVSCHSSFRNSGPGGGKLGLPLTGAFSKFGGSGLTSAIKNAAFPTMREPYRNHEITQTEAEHLAAYLQSVDAQPEVTYSFTLIFSSLIGGAFLLGLLGILYRNRLISVRQTLKS